MPHGAFAAQPSEGRSRRRTAARHAAHARVGCSSAVARQGEALRVLLETCVQATGLIFLSPRLQRGAYSCRVVALLYCAIVLYCIVAARCQHSPMPTFYRHGAVGGHNTPQPRVIFPAGGNRLQPGLQVQLWCVDPSGLDKKVQFSVQLCILQRLTGGGFY